MAENEITLEPCPVCGGRVEIDDPEAHLRNVGFCIECDPCNLFMWSFGGDTPTTLAARWNSYKTDHFGAAQSALRRNDTRTCAGGGPFG